MPINLETPLSELPGVGPQFLARLKKLNHIKTVRDLLYHFPSRYEDWSEIVKISELLELGAADAPTVAEAMAGKKALASQGKTIQGEVKEIDVRRAWKRRMVFVEATIADESGDIQAIWFNQPYITKTLRPGIRANFAGKLTVRGKIAQLSNPAYELVGRGETKHTGRLVPIYPETKGLTSKGIRFLMKPIVENFEPIPDSLPDEVRNENGLLEINEALREIHFPKNMKSAQRASHRFAFEEIFLLQLRNLRQKLALRREKAPKLDISVEKIKSLIDKLPFELTESQKKSLWEIVQDLERPYPMNRLLQGDVGSGKTVVAGIPAIATAQGETGHQVAIMAPTEILARQHYKTFVKLFGSFTGGIALLVGKEAKVFYGGGLETEIKKEKLFKEISAGNIKIVIGTHALIQKNVKFANLGLVIIDEQHRFGVEQRAHLIKSGPIPNFLSMSATPIPRTMMIAIFGDLDLSIIDELPKGRKEIITKVVASENRDKAYAFIRGQVRQGRQVYVICPRIEKPEENMDYKELLTYDAKAVEEEYEKLSKKIFPDLRVAMLHGKMKSKKKAEVMANFSEHKTDILVSTSVIEVGVDVPNATIMVIEGAERFGLAQLYQFRGRVGRGGKQSFCFLFTESKSEKATSRLKALITAKNGFELAEYDLTFRGPGQFLGGTQTGIPDIAMRALKDPNLIKEARIAAENIIKTNPSLEKSPLLREKLNKLKEEIHME